MRDYYQQCLSIAKDIEDKGMQAIAYCSLGSVYFRQDDLNAARKYYQQFLNTSKNSENKVVQAFVYLNLGILYLRLSELSKAEACIKISVDVYDNIKGLLHSQDDWKISLRNEQRDALWVLQLN